MNTERYSQLSRAMLDRNNRLRVGSRFEFDKRNFIEKNRL